MSEEGIETHELREQLEEAKEHAEHAQHGGHDGRAGAAHGGAHTQRGWTLYLSLSTAIIAVFAAIASLQSGAFESEALLKKNEAILTESKATDQWAYFQAKGTKAAIYEAQAESAKGAGGSPELAQKLDARREGYKKEQEEIEKTARELEAEVKARDTEGEEAFHHHHRFALSVTIFQIAIALSAIAALTKRKPLWWVSMAVGAAGAALFLLGFGVLGG